MPVTIWKFWSVYLAHGIFQTSDNNKGYDILTPWSRVFLEKLTGFQLVKKFPTFYGTRMFITAFTSTHHLSLSWAISIQSIPPHPTSWRSILILSYHLRLGLLSGLFPSGFPTKTLYTPLLYSIRATCTTHLILLAFIIRTILGEEYLSLSSSLCSYLHSPVTSSVLGPNMIKLVIYIFQYANTKCTANPRITRLIRSEKSSRNTKTRKVNNW